MLSVDGSETVETRRKLASLRAGHKLFDEKAANSGRPASRVWQPQVHGDRPGQAVLSEGINSS